jgi:hypothetical protein
MDPAPPTAPTSAYISRARHIHLVAASASPFADSLPRFLQDLGLTVHLHNLNSSDVLQSLIQLWSSADNPATVAVLALESEANGASKASRVRLGRLSSLVVAAAEVCVAYFTASNTVAVAQAGDPFIPDFGDLDILRLADTPHARAAFKQRITAAGCTLAGQILEEDQPSHNFEHPREWWSAPSSDPPLSSFNEFLVDSAFNRELTQTKLQEKAMERVKKATELDLKYHYVGWKMAENWNALTDDNTYAHGRHRSGLSGQMADMASALPEDVSFRYISLGPGDGKTDVALLPELAKARTVTSCFFVDVSIELLQVATNRVITDLIETDRFAPRHIRAVLGDFEDSLEKLAPVLTTGDGDRSFFSLSGFTIGNSNERDLLSSLAEGMHPGDFLLMDARIHGLGEVTEITPEQRESFLAPYRSDAMKKFAFGPVEDLCDYTVRLGDDDVEIRYDPRVGTRFTTDVSNAINVYIDAVGIYANPDFREKIGLRSLRRGASAIERRRSLRLVTLTFYDFESLATWIEETRAFAVRWKRALEGTAVFLLERLAAEEL